MWSDMEKCMFYDIIKNQSAIKWIIIKIINVICQQKLRIGETFFLLKIQIAEPVSISCN